MGERESGDATDVVARVRKTATGERETPSAPGRIANMRVHGRREATSQAGCGP